MDTIIKISGRLFRLLEVRPPKHGDIWLSNSLQLVEHGAIEEDRPILEEFHCCCPCHNPDVEVSTETPPGATAS